MKKKFSFVLAIIMFVCTLSIALVACAPKDPDPFTAPVSTDAYDEIWNAWMKTNSFSGGETLGIDLSVDAKNASNASLTDLTIKIQAGLDKISGSDKEAIRLAIIDNNKNDDIIDVAINKNGLYFDILGMEKPLLFDELSLLALGVGEADIMSSIKTIYDGLFSLIGTEVTIDPVLSDKKAKLYNVAYTFGWDFSVLTNMLKDVDGLLAGLGGGIPAELVSVIKEVVPYVSNLLDGLDVNFKVETTGNTQTKVKKPAKGAPKYSYAGGTVASISATGSKDGSTLNIGINGLKLLNSVPTIEVPAEADLVKASVLKHQITGNINMRDASGECVSNYTYRINLDFTAQNILTTIKECVTTGSATPLLNKMFKEQKGKLFVEVNHTCGDTCKITHVNKKKADGSIISIAFSPEDFENNRVYVALDLQTIINNSLLSDLIGISMNSIFPSYYTTFSFDFLQYMDLVEARNSAQNLSSVASVSTVADEEVGFDIGAMLGKILAGLKTDQELQIELEDIRSILNEYIRPMLKENDPAEGTYWTILKAVNSLFQGVDVLAIDAEYTNGVAITENVIDLFTRVKEGSNAKKDFGENPDSQDNPANHKIIKGEVLGWNKDAAGNVMIYNGGTSKEPNSDLPNSVIYDDNGAYKTMSYGELMELVVDRYATSTKNTVVIKFKDIYGNDVESRMNIVEIVGLDPNVYTPQTVKLVLSNGGADSLSAGIGSSINNFLGTLKGLAGLASQLAPVKEIVTPEVVIETKITISEVTSVEWDQSKVAGIKNEQIFDENKGIYANGDALSDTNHLTITFADGTVHESDVKANNTANYVKSNKVAAWGTFTMQFAAFGEYNSITVPMDDSKGVDSQTISLLLGSDGTVTHKIANSIKNNTINGSMALQQGDAMSVIKAFAEKYGFEYAETTSILGSWTGANITFNKKGTYNMTLVGGHNAVLHLTFIIIEDSVDEAMYLGVSKEYNGKIGNYAFTKAEAEKAAALNTNANMTITVGGTDAEPTIKVEFAKTGKYTMTIVEKNGEYVIVNYNITEAAKTVEKLELNTENSIKLNELFTDVKFTKEVIEAAVNALNSANTGKITMTFNGDMENPTLTFTAVDRNSSSGYVMNMIGTNGELAKLTIKFNLKTVSKEVNIGADKVVVTEDEIGVPFTKEFAEGLANTQNTGSKKTQFTVEVVEDTDGKLSLEFTLLQPGSYTFTLTNKCEISIKANLVVNVNATVGTDLVLEKGTGEGQLNHNYSKYTFTTPVSNFNTVYADKATLVLNDSTLALTFSFTEAGEYQLGVNNMTINITVTAE